MHLPTGLLTNLFQGDQKQAPVLLITEDVLLVITTIHDMVNRPGVQEEHRLSEAPLRSEEGGDGLYQR